MFKNYLLLFLFSTNALAQTLQIEKGPVTRNDRLKGTLLLSSPLSGQGRLTLTWTDSYGRTVAVESRKVTLKDKAMPFELPLRPAVALHIANGDAQLVVQPADAGGTFAITC